VRFTDGIDFAFTQRHRACARRLPRAGAQPGGVCRALPGRWPSAASIPTSSTTAARSLPWPRARHQRAFRYLRQRRALAADPDGLGFSLVRASLSGDPDAPASWRASAARAVRRARTIRHPTSHSWFLTKCSRTPTCPRWTPSSCKTSARAPPISAGGSSATTPRYRRSFGSQAARQFCPGTSRCSPNPTSIRLPACRRVFRSVRSVKRCTCAAATPPRTSPATATALNLRRRQRRHLRPSCRQHRR